MKYFPRYFVIKVIKIYQKFFSFDHSPMKHYFPYGYCRYKPTCSEYAVAAIEKYGLILGTAKASWRILRCNPWSKGGWDPLK